MIDWITGNAPTVDERTVATTGLPFALDTALRAMTALDPVDRLAAADVATMLAAAPSRRGRRAGAHRRARATFPRIAGAATALAKRPD